MNIQSIIKNLERGKKLISEHLHESCFNATCKENSAFWVDLMNIISKIDDPLN